MGLPVIMSVGPVRAARAGEEPSASIVSTHILPWSPCGRISLSGFAIPLQQRESLGIAMRKTPCPQAAESLVLIPKRKGLGQHQKRLS